jgi:hypothetical protein
MPPAARSFDPFEFLTIARTIAREQTEGALRTAVSRAYYCMLHLAQQDTGINPAYGEIQYIGRFLQPYGRSMRKLARCWTRCMHGTVPFVIRLLHEQ